MGNILSDRKTWKGFAVLAIGSDNSDDVRRVRCSVEIKNWSTADAVNGNAVDQVASGLGSTDGSSEEAKRGVDGESEPSDRCSDGDRSWEETYRILSKVKEIWDKDHGGVCFQVGENKSMLGLNQVGSVRSLESDGLLPLISVANDVCRSGNSDPSAILVIQAEKPSSAAIGRGDADNVGGDTANECVPVHVAISFDGF